MKTLCKPNLKSIKQDKFQKHFCIYISCFNFVFVFCLYLSVSPCLSVFFCHFISFTIFACVLSSFNSLLYFSCSKFHVKAMGFPAQLEVTILTGQQSSKISKQVEQITRDMDLDTLRVRKNIQGVTCIGSWISSA